MGKPSAFGFDEPAPPGTNWPLFTGIPVIGTTGPFRLVRSGSWPASGALGIWFGVACAGHAWAQEADQGREVPKTLTFDEPGIDDEISLPTFILATDSAGESHEADLDFELDKRLTPRTSVQINVGYTRLPLAGTAVDGWQNVQVTLKYVVLSDPAAERLGSISLTREFGASGASRIGASAIGSTVVAGNIGQGFSPLMSAALLRPFAVTGVLGYTLPDQPGASAFQQALAAVSLQYSFDVLASQAGFVLPGMLRPFIPVVECVYAKPIRSDERAKATMAPGLIYAGDGFQLAAEALLPLRKASGTGVGFIAQLNVSLSMLGVPRLSRPLFP